MLDEFNRAHNRKRGKRGIDSMIDRTCVQFEEKKYIWDGVGDE